ncbi:MAG TPA: DUF5615 family PIN-like protein [Burkholderiales bacterium]|nr:DUF5615 family PIN-like protein [Burkholderiales bacterium]
MRLLADESCDHAVVRALHAAGHDVLAIAESAPGISDEAVIERAVRDQRIVLTDDKDFGQLVYAAARSASGVMFLRFPAAARETMSRAVVELVNDRGATLAGTFVTVQPGRVRVSRLPET